VLDIALDAYKADVISRRRLEELAEEAGISSELTEDLLVDGSEPVSPTQPV
jgi:hypothetical protein